MWWWSVGPRRHHEVKFSLILLILCVLLDSGFPMGLVLWWKYESLRWYVSHAHQLISQRLPMSFGEVRAAAPSFWNICDVSSIWAYRSPSAIPTLPRREGRGTWAVGEVYVSIATACPCFLPFEQAPGARGTVFLVFFLFFFSSFDGIFF